MFTSLAH